MQHKNTVLLVANYEPDVGYAWSFIQEFWLTFARYAHCIVAYPKRGSVPRELIEAGVTVHWQDVRGWRSIAYMRKHRITHVYLSDRAPWSILYFVWRLVGVRTIILHDHIGRDARPATGWRRLLKKIIHLPRVFSVDQCISVADHMRQQHVNTWCLPPSRCVTVQNGIRPFTVDRSERDMIRRAIGVPADATVFLLVGRAERKKGIDFAIRCLAMLPPHVHFVHCGHGPDLVDFVRVAVQCGVNDRMRFLGKRSDVKRIMAACDAAFHPSRVEAMSLAILEFMFAGLPVVVPDRPSVSFTVDHLLTGMVYRAENIDSAVTALTVLLDESERRRLGEAARAKALRSYTLDRTLATFTERVIAPLGLSPSSAFDLQSVYAGARLVNSDELRVDPFTSQPK